MEEVKKEKQPGKVSLIIGIAALLFSYMQLGYLGIIGIIFGIKSFKKKEPKKNKAVIGIICSVLAILLSLGALGNETDDTNGSDKSDISITDEKTQKSEESKSDKKLKATKEPTRSEDNDKKIIQDALKNGDKVVLKKYKAKQVSKYAVDILENAKFKNDDDYKIVSNISQTMKKLYPKDVNREEYSLISSAYNDYINAKKQMKKSEYEDIKDDYNEAKDILDNYSEMTLDVKYSIEDDTSKILSELKEAITGEQKDYKYAYYANGIKHIDYANDFIEDNEDEEYIIYAHDAFPKSGDYTLNLYPTGDTVKIGNNGFERNVATYMMITKEDIKKCKKIEKIVSDYNDYKIIKKESFKLMRTECGNLEIPD